MDVPIRQTDVPVADRLDGWKQVARHVGRGVRTAQRWERELGLPVRRISTGAAESVFAFASEIDAWLDLQSRASLAAEVPEDVMPDGGSNGTPPTATPRPVPSLPPSPIALPSPTPALPTGSRHNRVVTAVAVVAVALSIASAWQVFWRSPAGVDSRRGAQLSARPEPERVALSGNTLNAFGPQQELLWQHPLEVPLPSVPTPMQFDRATVVRDIDGDGHAEVLFANMNVNDPRVYGFSHDGTVRFVHDATRRVRFGEYVCPPVIFYDVFVEHQPRFRGEQDLYPVRRWNGTGYDLMSGPQSR